MTSMRGLCLFFWLSLLATSETAAQQLPSLADLMRPLQPVVVDPPFEQPFLKVRARTFHIDGAVVPVFRDKEAAAARARGEYIGESVPKNSIADVECVLPNNTFVSLTRYLKQQQKIIGALIQAVDIDGCHGYMDFRDLRVVLF